MRIGVRKGQLLQCFTYIYRRKRYLFLIVQILIELRIGEGDEDNSLDEDNSPVLDMILDLPIYKRQAN